MVQGRGVKAKLSKAVDDVLTFVHPRLSYSSGTIPNLSIVNNTTISAGETVINLISVGVWQLKAGDYIQFANHTKVYEVAEDSTLQSGAANVTLVFPILTSVISGTQAIVEDVTWYLESDGVIEVSMEASDNQDMQLTLNAVEKL